MSNVFVVVTPVFQETMAQIEKNHLSVVNQVFDYPATVKHLLVFDGPQATPAEHLADALSIRLPVNANDSGATPRAVGAAIGWTIPNASGLLFLDADNWFDQNHIQTLWHVQTRAEADIVTCARRLISVDGQVMGDCEESDGVNFCDTNCYLFNRSAWPLGTNGWTCQPDKQALWCDRRLWQWIKSSGLKIARSPAATVNYVTRVRDHYARFGMVPPASARNTELVGDIAKYV